MSDINVKMDISDVVSKTSQMLNLTKAQENALKNLVATTINLNQAGQAANVYTEKQISANYKLLTTITGIGTENERTSRTIKATTTAIQRQREELQKLLTTGARQKIDQITSKSGLQFKTEDLAKIEKIKSAISKLDPEIATAKTIGQLFKDIKAGNIPEATGALAKLRDELVKLAALQDRVRAQTIKDSAGSVVDRQLELQRRAIGRSSAFQAGYTNKFVDPIAAALGIDKDKLSLAQEAQIRKVGSSIARIMRNSVNEDLRRVVDTKQLQQLLPDLLSGKKLDFVNRPELQAASDQLAKLIALFERLRNAQERTATAAATKSTAQAAKAAVTATNAQKAADFRATFERDFLTVLEQQFKIKKTDLTTRQEGIIRNAAAALARQVAATGLDKATVQQLFDQIRAGGVVTPPTGELAKTASELTKVIGLFERLRQERDRQARVNQNALDQRIISDKEAQKLETRIRGIQKRLDLSFRNVRAQLANVDPQLDVGQKFTNLIRKVAELGAKSGLSARAIAELNQRVQNNQLTQADTKYARLIDLLTKLNAQIERAKANANNFTGQPIFPGVPPVGTGEGGGGRGRPSRNDIANAERYSTIFEKIRNSLDYFLLYRGFNLLSNELVQAYDNARKFQIQISLIRTISQDAQLSFREWERGLIDVSNKTGVGFLDVSAAAYDAISNQVASGREALDFTKDATEFSKVVNASALDSVNILSSAINSYGIDVSKTEEVSAKFFKTIDLGRIQAKDLANTFGRVAFVGRDLGADFEELLAILSTLTRNGVTTDDAITLLTNGMNKLTNPTEKMKAVLAEFGFSSGRAAVQTLGFTETMLKLISAVESGKIEITDLFNEIRGEKYASAFKTFKGEIIRDLDEIKNKSLDTYRSAVSIRGESDAQAVTEQINKLKNTLATNFGNEFTNLVKNFIDFSGGVDNLAKNINELTRVLIIGGSAFVTYKGVILAVQSGTALYNAAQATSNGLIAVGTRLRFGATAAESAQAVATAAGTTAKIANTGATAANTAQMRLNAAAYYAHPIGLFVAAAGALYAYYQTTNYEIGVHNEKLNGLSDIYDEIINKQKEVVKNDAFKGFENTFDQFKNKFKGVGEVIATELSTANRALLVARDRSKETSQDLKTGFDQYTNAMKNRISEIAREYERLDDRIRNSSKSILSLRELARSQLFETKLKYSGGFEFDRLQQRERLMVQEAARLKEQIRTLFASGTDEDVQKARQLAQEYLKIKKDIFDIQQERDKLNLEQDVKNNPQRYRTNEFGKVVRLVDTRPLEQEQQSFLNFFEGLEKQYQDRIKAKNITDEKQLLKAKDRLQQAEAAIRQLDSIKLFDEGGNVLPEFKDETTGRVNIDKVRKRFDEARKKVRSTIDPEVLKKFGPEVEKLIDDRIGAIEVEIKAAEKVEIARKRQTEFIEGQKKLDKQFQDSRRAVQGHAQDIENLADKYSKLSESLNVLLGENLVNVFAQKERYFGSGTALQRAAGVGLEKLGTFFDSNASTPTTEARKRIQPLRDELASIRSQFEALPSQTITENGVQRIDENALRATLERLTAFKEKVKAALREGLGTDQVVPLDITNAAGIPQIEQIEAELKKRLSRSAKEYNQSVGSIERLKSETQNLDSLTDSTLQNFERFGPAAQSSLGIAATTFSDFNGKLVETNNQLNGIIAKLTNLTSEKIKVFGINTNIPKHMMGGNIPYYANGGPVGSDMQAIYAQSGEYIWNRGATRRFYSQISAMNSQGRTPINFSTTEGDTINVGGININESKSPQLTGHEVLRQMRRAQRRG